MKNFVIFIFSVFFSFVSIAQNSNDWVYEKYHKFTKEGDLANALGDFDSACDFYKGAARYLQLSQKSDSREPIDLKIKVTCAKLEAENERRLKQEMEKFGNLLASHPLMGKCQNFNIARRICATSSDPRSCIKNNIKEDDYLMETLNLMCGKWGN